MNVEEEKLPSFIYFLCATVILFSFSIFSIIGFWDACYYLIDHFINNTQTIVFDRGGTFGLGCFFGLLSLSVGAGIVGVQGKKLTGKSQKIVTYGLVVGMATIFLLPLVSSISIGMYAYNKGYTDCNEAEYKPTWAIYRVNYYTKDQVTCNELVEEVKRNRPFL